MGAQRISLSYGGELYDRTQSLYYGYIRPEGVDLQFHHMNIEALFHRQAQFGEFDLSEFSFGAYLASL